VRRAWPLVGAAAVFAGACLLVNRHHVAGWERHLTIWFAAAPAWVAHGLWPVMQFGTLLVSVVVAVVAAMAFGVRRGIVVFASAFLAWWLSGFVKDIVARDRPAAFIAGLHVRDHVVGAGFSSGHTAVAFAVAAALAPALPRGGKVLAFTLASLVGVARMVYGVHFPLDVVGGAAFGIMCGALVSLLGDAVAHDRRDHAQAEHG